MDDGITVPRQSLAIEDRSSSAFLDVLCAVDGTRRSYTAVEQAAALAGPDGRLTLLAVTAPAGAGAYRSAAIDATRVTRVLDRGTRIAEDAGVSSTTVVDSGAPPARVILQAAARHDLLALGAPAMSWVGAMLVGGVAFEALRSAAAPVLIARQASGTRRFADHILVASDALDESDRIVEIAGRIALGIGASVTLLHTDGVESAARSRRVEQQSHTLQSLLPDRSETVTESGDAATAIVAAAGGSGASLIVMGNRRRHGPRALASVSRRVVHEGPCSVLAVPPASPPE